MARRLTPLRGREECAKPYMVRILFPTAKNRLRLRGQSCHAFASARPRTNEHQTSDQLRLRERNFLRDEAAERKAEHVDWREAQCPDEGNGIYGHFLHRRGH